MRVLAPGAIIQFRIWLMTATILLTHTPEMRRNYYGERALAGLGAVGTVRLHEGAAALDAAGLIPAAQGCAIIAADRQTPGEAPIFPALPHPAPLLPCAAA